jgi:hypothetical protein
MTRDKVARQWLQTGIAGTERTVQISKLFWTPSRQISVIGTNI